MGYSSHFNNCGGPLEGTIAERLGERYLVVKQIVENLPAILELWTKLEGYTDLSVILDAKLSDADKGIANGVAPLDAANQLPLIHLSLHRAEVDPHPQYLNNARGDARYAALGNDGRLTAAQLPTYVDDVLEFANTAAFPQPGEAGKIYVSAAQDATYRWSGSTYIMVGDGNGLGGIGSTDALAEGTVNLYHTSARVRAVTLTGLDIAVGGSIAAGDSVLVAFGKLQQQTNDIVAALGTKASQSDLSALSTAVAGKAAASHTHSQNDISGLVDALAGKANTNHTHAIGGVSGLVDALAALQTKVLVGTAAPSGGNNGDVYFKVPA